MSVDADGDAVTIQRQSRPDRRPRTGRAPAGDHGHVPVVVEGEHRSEVGAEHGADLLGDRGEDLVRRRLSGNEHRQPSQRRLLAGQLAQIVGGAFGVREVAHCTADEQRLALDGAQGELDGKLAAVGAHPRQLDQSPEHPRLAGLDEACERAQVALTQRRRND